MVPFPVVNAVAWRLSAASSVGAGWQGAEHDLITTGPDGTAIHPQVLTRRFGSTSKAAGLPTIRLHDVRHSYATAALASGVQPKGVAAFIDG